MEGGQGGDGLRIPGGGPGRPGEGRGRRRGLRGESPRSRRRGGKHGQINRLYDFGSDNGQALGQMFKVRRIQGIYSVAPVCMPRGR